MPGAAPPESVRGWAAPRPWTPLALTLGLHLLLVLAWLTGMRGADAPGPPQREARLVFVQPQARPVPAPAVPPPLAPPRPRPRQRASIGVPPIALPAPAVFPEPRSDPVVAPQATAAPGDLLATSRAMAGKADRELRKGASPITAEPERKWERFADAFAAARTSTGNTVTLEVYEAPDGATIYRKTVAGRKVCYRSGSVGGLQTGFGVADGRGAGPTPCPSGVSWTQL